MSYLRIRNGQAEAYCLKQLAQEFPRVSFPCKPSHALLAQWGIYPYTRPARPGHDPLTERIADGAFTQGASGDWELPFVTVLLDQGDAENNIRAQRDRLLARTDWRFRSDLSPDPAWAQYCQALRDVPTQEGFPYDVIWPVPPA